MWFRATCIESYECVWCRVQQRAPARGRCGAAALPPRGARRLYVVYVARAVYWPFYDLYLWGPAGRSYPVRGGGFGSAAGLRPAWPRARGAGARPARRRAEPARLDPRSEEEPAAPPRRAGPDGREFLR